MFGALEAQPPIRTTPGLGTFSTTIQPGPSIGTTSTAWIFFPGSSTTESTLTPKIESTSRSITTTTSAPRHPCEDNLGKTIEDPQSCMRFIVCVLSIPYTYSCPSGTIFDAESLRCLHGDPVTCELSSIEKSCEGIFFGALPHPTDPNLYIGCVEYKAYIMPCDEGKVFEASAGECL